MATKPEAEALPTGTKALRETIAKDLRTQVAQEQQGRAADAHAHEQAIQTLHEAHEHAVSLMAQDVAEARDIAARSMNSAQEMSGNRDLWVGRLDRGRALLIQALAALDGTDEKREPVELPAAPEPEETDVER